MSAAAERPWNIRKPETAPRPSAPRPWANKPLAPDPRIVLARRVRLEDVVLRYDAKLKRQGPELVGPCPRCGDRFSIHSQKQVWLCCGCGAGGDVVALVMHFDGVEFSTALEQLRGLPHGGAPQPRDGGR
jgi:CHC2 zinc finger